jgi:predicted TIM-barrel fold metal-dependent hydrolase
MSTRHAEWDGIPIIDAHIHLGEDMDGSSCSEGELLRLMDENRLQQGLVLPFNEAEADDNFLSATQKNLALRQRFPDRILCGFRVDPKKDFQGTVGFARENRIPVMKLHPTSQEFKIDSPCLRDLLDDIQESGYRPLVFVHTDIIPEEGTGCEMLNCPKDVIQVARRYPDLCFVIAHCGRWCEATRIGIARVDNVYIDTSIAPLFLIRKCLSIVGSDRVVYGSDYPYSHPRIELEKIHLLNLRDKDAEAILGGNLRRVLSIPTA